jgi:hypothetical protein
MKVYTLHNLFLFGGTTKENYPYLVIGKQLQDDARYFTYLKNLLDNFSVPTICSAQALDRILAAALQEAVPRPFIIGCTIGIPGMEGPSGGVLGNPNSEVLSAEGRMEDYERDWKVLTYPGGPGLAFQEKDKGVFLPDAIDIKNKASKGKYLLLDLAAQAYSSGVEEFLAITDGTGKDVSGSAIIQYRREYVIWTLTEVSFKR